MRSTSAPNAGVVIICNVRGRGRSMAVASTMRPGLGVSAGEKIPH
jgi:hypothetical protein